MEKLVFSGDGHRRVVLREQFAVCWRHLYADHCRGWGKYTLVGGYLAGGVENA